MSSNTLLIILGWIMVAILLILFVPKEKISFVMSEAFSMPPRCTG